MVCDQLLDLVTQYSYRVMNPTSWASAGEKQSLGKITSVDMEVSSYHLDLEGF